MFRGKVAEDHGGSGATEKGAGFLSPFLSGAWSSSQVFSTIDQDLPVDEWSQSPSALKKKKKKSEDNTLSMEWLNISNVLLCVLGCDVKYIFSPHSGCEQNNLDRYFFNLSGYPFPMTLLPGCWEHTALGVKLDASTFSCSTTNT